MQASLVHNLRGYLARRFRKRDPTQTQKSFHQRTTQDEDGRTICVEYKIICHDVSSFHGFMRLKNSSSFIDCPFRLPPKGA
jgi:hypothetical protein